MAQAQRVADSYDVIVAGSGIAGLSAALAAAESGLSVAVFEKDCVIGGGTSLSYGGIWVGCNHIAKASGIEDSLEAVREYMRFVAGGSADDELLETFIQNSPAIAEFYQGCGIKFQLTRGFADHYYPIAPGSVSTGRMFEPEPISLDEVGDLGPRIRDPIVDPRLLTVEEISRWGGMTNHPNWDHAVIEHRKKNRIRANGPALIIHFVKALKDRDISIFLNTPIESLERADHGVSGARLLKGRLVRATKGVVLATGGWEGDPVLAHEFEAAPEAHPTFPPAISGDGWKLAVKMGASTALIRNNLAIILGFPVPPSQGATESEFRLAQILECLCPHTVIVNSNGERFSDETYFQETAEELRRFDIVERKYRNLPCYLIFDSQYVEAFSFCGGPVGAMPPQWVERADTMGGLADCLKISREGLESTVARFNGFARQGRDEDFHRGEKRASMTRRDAIKVGNPVNQRLGTLEKPPFFGIRLYPGVFVSSGGVRINRHGQAVDAQGCAIPKLYAIGNTAAHLEYGIGYQAGYSLASGMTFGYLAVQHMIAASMSNAA
jgi:succinate dehydrogenase/fumarate reductase flavoprotein subunit